MRKLFVTLVAALALVMSALAVAAPAQATATSEPTPAPTAAPSPDPATDPLTPEEQAAADKAAAEKAAKEKAAEKKAAKEKAAKKRAAKKKAEAKARKKRAQKRAAQRALRTWNQLAHCESTSRWHVDTGNGYYGGLQISPSTWRAFGGKRFAGLPHQASKTEQIKIGKNIKNGQGWGAWPSCSRRLGLR